MSELCIRRYEPADQRRVLELHVEPMEAVDAFVDTEEADHEDLMDITDTYIEAGGDFLVGECEGKIVGMGAFRPPSSYLEYFLDELPPGTAEVTRMRVDSDYQGRGYGQQLYEEIERRARIAGVQRFVLDTTQRQVATRGLYETNGFRETHREDVEFGGTSLTMIFYEKPLDPGSARGDDSRSSPDS